MNPSYLAEQFATALSYDRYVQTGNEDQRRRWRQVYDAARVTEGQTRLVSGFVRDMKVLVDSGI